MSSSTHTFGVKPLVLFGVLLLILLIPSGIFIFKSYSQLDRILTQIGQEPKMHSVEFVSNFDANASDLFFERATIALEHDVMLLRKQRSATLLATRTWMRFMSLIFGAILVVIGSAFILGRVTATPTDGQFSLADLSLNLSSSSPGIFLTAFGAILISIPNLSQQRIETNDTSTYVEVSVASSTNQYEQKRDEAIQEILQGLGPDENASESTPNQ